MLTATTPTADPRTATKRSGEISEGRFVKERI
jgi:hypothetical protein